MNRTMLYVLVTATVMMVLGLVTHVYLSVYRVPQERSIERLLTRLYAAGSNGDDDGNRDSVRRDRILRLRQRMGVGIDSLPTVRFSSLVPKGDGDAVVDDGGRAAAEQRARQRECLTVGAYLGSEDDYVDCRSYCGVSDGVDYRFYDRAGLLLNRRKGRSGGYCVPNDAAVCNTNTSLVLYSMDGWRCMPQTRAFAGDGGNLITVCGGALLDRATGRVGREHIDPKLSFESIVEKLPGVDESDDAHGGYRFVCPPGNTDEIGNALISSPLDRLVQIRNVCASLIPYADTNVIRPDFESGECECGDGDDLATLDPVLGICVPPPTSSFSVSGSFRRDTLETLLRRNRAAVPGVADDSTVEPCVEMWSVSSFLDALAGTDSWRDRGGFQPCGVENGGDGDSGGSMPACVRTYARVFDRAVPSPYAMLESSVSVRDLGR